MEEHAELTDASSSSLSSANDYIFGFGSIMNTSTHAVWKTTTSGSSSSSTTTTNESLLPGAIATISKEFGYNRQWSFRSSTGFTALGVNQCGDATTASASEINGVLFQVP